MPGYKTHLSFGLLTFLGLLYILLAKSILVLSFKMAILGTCACLLGSIFPDIDTTSKMQKIFYIFATLFIFYTLFTGNFIIFLSLSLISMVILLLKHRTITHNFLFILGISCIFPMLAYFTNKNTIFIEQTILVSASFAIGALFHVFLDLFVSKLKK